MWRLGVVSTSHLLKELPDVAAYGKMLTGKLLHHYIHACMINYIHFI